MNKIALGTVQFGLDYGINNTLGEVTTREVAKILNFSKEKNIVFLDTAHAYGSSERKLGTNDLSGFKIISKLPKIGFHNPSAFFEESLNHLNVQELYGYLIHDFDSFEKNQDIWNTLLEYKNRKKVKKIGFSLYSPNQLNRILDLGLNVDILQIPLNIFDQRFIPYLNVLAKKNVEVHCRSVFLQGLFFKEPQSLHKGFEEVKRNLKEFDNIRSRFKLSKVQSCLGWVLSLNNIDKVVIGVDSLKQLESNYFGIQDLKSKNIPWAIFSKLKVSNENEINPVNW